MPDPLLILESIAAALLVSALVVAASRSLDRRWAGVAQALAIALGACAGLFVLDVHHNWPPREDQDRFLLLVLPAVLLLDAAGNTPRASRAVKTVVRLIAAMAVTPVLLHGSSYVADLAGPGSAEWPPATRYPILAGLGLALFAGWSLLEWTAKRSASALRAPFALAIAVGGASLAVMLSGYASGGMNGLPLGAALAGGSVLAALWRGDDRDALPGAGVVILFGLLLVGYGFGELKPDAAAILFLAPMLAALPEVPPLASLRPFVRTIVGLVLVALATAAAVGLTVHRFQTQEAAGVKSDGPSADDYSQFR